MLERETGIEPATSSLGSWRSTAELLPLVTSNITHRRHSDLDEQAVRDRSPATPELLPAPGGNISELLEQLEGPNWR